MMDVSIIIRKTASVTDDVSITSLRPLTYWGTSRGVAVVVSLAASVELESSCGDTMSAGCDLAVSDGGAPAAWRMLPVNEAVSAVSRTGAVDSDDESAITIKDVDILTLQSG
jgi:hypothetical protein